MACLYGIREMYNSAAVFVENKSQSGYGEDLKLPGGVKIFNLLKTKFLDRLKKSWACFVIKYRSYVCDLKKSTAFILLLYPLNCLTVKQCVKQTHLPVMQILKPVIISRHYLYTDFMRGPHSARDFFAAIE